MNMTEAEYAEAYAAWLARQKFAKCEFCQDSGYMVVQDGEHPLDAHEEPCELCGAWEAKHVPAEVIEAFS